MTLDSAELVPVAPELFVPDVGEAVRFYTGQLGFETKIVEPEGEPGPRTMFAVVALGPARVLLAHDVLYGEPLAGPRGLGVDIRFMVKDVDAVYGRVRAARLKIVREIGDRDYGLRDFIVADLNGFRLRFAAPLR